MGEGGSEGMSVHRNKMDSETTYSMYLNGGNLYTRKETPPSLLVQEGDHGVARHARARHGVERVRLARDVGRRGALDTADADRGGRGARVQDLDRDGAIRVLEGGDLERAGRSARANAHRAGPDEAAPLGVDPEALAGRDGAAVQVDEGRVGGLGARVLGAFPVQVRGEVGVDEGRVDLLRPRLALALAAARVVARGPRAAEIRRLRHPRVLGRRKWRRGVRRVAVRRHDVVQRVDGTEPAEHRLLHVVARGVAARELDVEARGFDRRSEHLDELGRLRTTRKHGRIRRAGFHNQSLA